MRKPWQELGSPAKGFGGGSWGSATGEGLLPLRRGIEAGEGPGWPSVSWWIELTTLERSLECLAISFFLSAENGFVAMERSLMLCDNRQQS